MDTNIDAPIDTPDPTAFLDVNPLPAGFSLDALDRIQIPTQTDPLKCAGVPIDLDFALLQVFEAGERMSRRYDRDALNAEAATLLAGFRAAGEIQGIQVLPEHAIRTKRDIIEREQEATTREAQAEYARWRAVAARLLVEARAASIAAPVEPFTSTAAPTDHLAALRDLIEADRTDRYFEQETLSQLVDRYQRTGDGALRAFVRAMESGRRPFRTDPSDVIAEMRLARVIKERQAARVPAWVRQAFARYDVFTGGTKGAQQSLIKSGKVHAGDRAQ